MKKIMVIDTETGGLDKNIHSLLSVGIYVPEDMTLTQTLYHKVPQYTVTPYAMQVNRLNLEYVQKNGLTTDGLQHKLESIFTDNYIYLGHNLQFDANFLGTLNSNFIHQIMRNHIDTKALALNAIYNGKLPENQGTGLKDLADFFGINSESHHDALADCYMTYGVFLCLNQL